MSSNSVLSHNYLYADKGNACEPPARTIDSVVPRRPSPVNNRWKYNPWPVVRTLPSRTVDYVQPTPVSCCCGMLSPVSVFRTGNFDAVAQASSCDSGCVGGQSAACGGRTTSQDAVVAKAQDAAQRYWHVSAQDVLDRYWMSGRRICRAASSEVDRW